MSPDVVRYERVDRVAVVTIDNPPVNALSPAVWQGLDDAIRRAAGDPAVDAVVLAGAGSTFIAGADIKVFATLKTRDQSLERSAGTHALLKRIEDCPKPIVAAIQGVALGGGHEVAMSCHYRIASRDASVGQPEVLLGIIPGAGDECRSVANQDDGIGIRVGCRPGDGLVERFPDGHRQGVDRRVVDRDDGGAAGNPVPDKVRHR